MSAFDPTLFLDATITEASTKRNPIPAGTDVVGIIGEVKARQWAKRDDPTKTGVAMDVPVEFDLTAYPNVKAAVGADKITLTDSIMLDLTESGTIDTAPGQNSKLRRYREALGMNQDGQPFSFRAMSGRQIKCKISHRTYEGEVYDQIEGVAKA
jgi:hypothetical protein